MIISNDRKSPQLRLHEKAYVEDPFLDQLESLGWEVVRLQQVPHYGVARAWLRENGSVLEEYL